MVKYSSNPTDLFFGRLSWTSLWVNSYKPMGRVTSEFMKSLYLSYYTRRDFEDSRAPTSSSFRIGNIRYHTWMSMEVIVTS